MYLNQYWRDERLAFNIYGPYYDSDADDDGVNDVLTLSGDFAEKIWVPDTFFANDKNRWAFFPFLSTIYIYLLSLRSYAASYTMSPNETNWCVSAATAPSPTACGSPRHSPA